MICGIRYTDTVYDMTYCEIHLRNSQVKVLMCHGSRKRLRDRLCSSLCNLLRVINIIDIFISDVVVGCRLLEGLELLMSLLCLVKTKGQGHGIRIPVPAISAGLLERPAKSPNSRG